MSASLGVPEVRVRLTKPLGLVLEEVAAGEQAGVEVSSLVAGSAAEASGLVRAGDRLIEVGGEQVGTLGFDGVMEALRAAPPTVELVLARTVYAGDELPLDVTPNLAKSLSTEHAIAVDKVVRAAREELRASPRAARELGRLLKVEIVIGAAVRPDERTVCVRFFAIFSTTGIAGGSSYSCNVSATGVVDTGSSRVDITKLSAAKDEGWGQTVDIL